MVIGFYIRNEQEFESFYHECLAICDRNTPLFTFQDQVTDPIDWTDTDSLI